MQNKKILISTDYHLNSIIDKRFYHHTFFPLIITECKYQLIMNPISINTLEQWLWLSRQWLWLSRHYSFQTSNKNIFLTRSRKRFLSCSTDKDFKAVALPINVTDWELCTIVICTFNPALSGNLLLQVLQIIGLSMTTTSGDNFCCCAHLTTHIPSWQTLQCVHWTASFFLPQSQ